MVRSSAITRVLCAVLGGHTVSRPSLGCNYRQITAVPSSRSTSHRRKPAASPRRTGVRGMDRRDHPVMEAGANSRSHRCATYSTAVASFADSAARPTEAHQVAKEARCRSYSRLVLAATLSNSGAQVASLRTK
ncbi:hypothetical protein GCM10009727_19450 [Actinomadura napierensis]|uniref:Secreted protein n=1 Tax=Actinomadura napierensis TaxID=267854 RepID=A0ABN2YK83_9ACTN